MSFQSLEKTLRSFFRHGKTPVEDSLMKRKISYEVMEAFRNKKVNERTHFLTFFFGKDFSFRWAPVAVCTALVALFGGSFLTGNVESKLVYQEGLIEVVRDGKSILVSETFVLQPGDIIQTASSARGSIISENRFAVDLEPNTQVNYTQNKNLYLAQGNIEAQIFRAGSISTDRGMVRTPKEGRLMLAVSPTGETQVVLQENEAYVQDWNKGRQVLALGDAVRLRTDTILTDINIPRGIDLSLDQILALRSQFSISRTKAVNALEQLALSNTEKAEQHLASAERSFRSTIQVLEADRNLAMVQQKDTNVFQNGDVIRLLQERDAGQDLVNEAQALSQLFALMEKGESLFSEEFTGLNAFDRYRMIDRAFASAGDAALGEILKEKYAIAFLQDLQNRELATEQQEVLERHLALLPDTTTASEFLDRVKALSDPKLARLLKEKTKARLS